MTTRGSLIEQSHHYLQLYIHKIHACVDLLSEDEVWQRPAAGTNTVGNLLLHLTGNLSLWVLDGLGGEYHERHREQEFTADRTATKEELVADLTLVVERCQLVIHSLTPAELATPRVIQKYQTDGYGALFHAVEHMSYHTGQIVYWTKMVTAGRAQIEFYPQHRGE